MTTTGAELVTIGDSLRGHPYRNWGDRFGPWFYDCSGLQVAILRLGQVAIPQNVGLNSEGLDVWGRDAGLEIPLADAYTIPGAFVSRWGVGDNGHIAMVRTPQVDTIETPAWGVWGHGSGNAPLLGRDWTNASCAPGVDFTGRTPLEDLLALVASMESAMRLTFDYGTVHPVAVTWLQVMLNRTRKASNPLVVDGAYGLATLNALLAWENNVTAFMHMDPHTFPHSGHVDATVWYWLKLSAKI